MPAIAACLGAGMMLIAAGEVMQRGEMPTAAAATIVAPAALPAAEPLPTSAVDEPSATSLVGTLPPPPAAVAAPEATRPAPRARGTTRERSEAPPTTRTTRTTAKVKKAGTRPGMLDRLKLRWLKNAFAIRADAL